MLHSTVFPNYNLNPRASSFYMPSSKGLINCATPSFCDEITSYYLGSSLNNGRLPQNRNNSQAKIGSNKVGMAIPIALSSIQTSHPGYNPSYLSVTPVCSTSSELEVLFEENLSRSSSSSSLTSSIFGNDKEKLPVPPKHNVMYHPSRYKTEICRQFEELGTCEYGDRCLFAHGFYELKSLPNRHPKYKTERCSAYHDDGFCSFGPRCSFLHVKPTCEEILDSIEKAKLKMPMPGNRSKQSNELRKEEEDDYKIDYDIFKDQGSKNRLPIFKKICPTSRS